MRATFAALADLVFPTPCAGCGAAGQSLCPACRRVLEAARPRPARPRPSPVGMPPTMALAPYSGQLRSILVTYKERGRRGLSEPLGTCLGDVVRDLLVVRPPLTVLIPVPATAEAIRRRGGDHMAVLAEAAVRALRGWGWAAVSVSPLRTAQRRRADSTRLTASHRRLAAAGAFVMRCELPALVGEALPARTATVVVDDIVTTGSTLASATSTLRAGGVVATGAAVLAATGRRT